MGITKEEVTERKKQKQIDNRKAKTKSKFLGTLATEF